MVRGGLEPPTPRFSDPQEGVRTHPLRSITAGQRHDQVHGNLLRSAVFRPVGCQLGCQARDIRGSDEDSWRNRCARPDGPGQPPGRGAVEYSRPVATCKQTACSLAGCAPTDKCACDPGSVGQGGHQGRPRRRESAGLPATPSTLGRTAPRRVPNRVPPAPTTSCLRARAGCADSPLCAPIGHPPSTVSFLLRDGGM